MKDLRYYIRNYHIDDNEYNEIINDLLHEIAYKTNIWKKEFWFDVVHGQDYYDFNALLSMYEHDEYSTIVDTAPDGYDSDTKDYSQSIANIIDVRFDHNKIGNLITKSTKNISVIGSTFEYENMFTLRYIGKTLDDGDYQRYFTVVSIVPTIKQINEMRETLVTKCIIAGLRYKVASMYQEQNDYNFIMFLKKDYELELYKLKDVQNNYAFWHKKMPNKGMLI